MEEDLRQNLPAIIIAWIVGIVAGTALLLLVRSNAAGLDVNAFSWLVFLVPSAVTLLVPFVVTLLAMRIGRQFYVAMLGLSLLVGIAAMVMTSAWMQDGTITSLLLANSPEGTEITPILRAPMIILRDIAAFVVCPTVGCIAGAWIGSRLHPVTSQRGKRRSTKAKSKKKQR